ncbi:unnamed protein product [Rotaria socialis]
MNQIMCEADVSQIRSQTRIPLKDQSQSGIRHLVSKLNRGVQAVQVKWYNNTTDHQSPPQLLPHELPQLFEFPT